MLSVRIAAIVYRIVILLLFVPFSRAHLSRKKCDKATNKSVIPGAADQASSKTATSAIVRSSAIKIIKVIFAALFLCGVVVVHVWLNMPAAHSAVFVGRNTWVFFFADFSMESSLELRQYLLAVGVCLVFFLFYSLAFYKGILRPIVEAFLYCLLSEGAEWIGWFAVVELGEQLPMYILGKYYLPWLLLVFLLTVVLLFLVVFDGLKSLAAVCAELFLLYMWKTYHGDRINAFYLPIWRSHSPLYISYVFLATLIVVVILILFAAAHHKKWNKYTAQRVFSTIILLLGITDGFCMLLLAMSQNGGIESMREAELCAVVGITLALFVAFLCYSGWLNVLQNQNAKLLEEQKVHELEAQEYQNLLHTTDVLRKIKHDMDIHLDVMQMMAQESESEQLISYIEGYRNQVKEIYHLVSTGNTAIDCVMSDKIEEAQKNGIKVEYSVLLPDRMPLDDISMSALLGNLWNNALNACRKVENPGINFYIKPFQDMVLIHMENNYTDEVGPQGIGLSRIRSIVESVGGVMQIITENQLYAVHIMIPLLEKEEAELEVKQEPEAEEPESKAKPETESEIESDSESESEVKPELESEIKAGLEKNQTQN